jgi:hypothetical protein
VELFFHYRRYPGFFFPTFFKPVKERGEIDKIRAVIYMRARVRKQLRKKLGRELADRIYIPAVVARRRSKRLLRVKLRNAFEVLPDNAG